LLITDVILLLPVKYDIIRRVINMKKNTKLLAYCALCFVVLTWGLSPVIGKIMLGFYSPGIKRLLDAIFATAALGAIAGRQLKALDKGTLRFSLVMGLCFSVAMLLEGVALNYTTPAKSNFYGNFSCVTVPVFVALFTRTLPRPGKVLAGLLCLVGFGVIVFGNTLSGGIPSFSMGDGLTLASAVFYGITTAAIGTWGKNRNPLLLTFLEFCVTVPMCALYVVCFEEVAFSWAWKDLLTVAAAAVVVQGLCWLLRNFAVRHIEPGLVAIIMSFSTVVSGVVSILAGMDTFTWSLAIGGVLCAAAAVLSGLSGVKKQKSA